LANKAELDHDSQAGL